MPAPDRLPNPRPARLRAWLAASLCGVWLLGVALAPVWFGSNEPLAWGAHALLFGLILAAYGAIILAFGQQLPVPLARLWLPLAATAIVLGWAAIQTVPWVPASWRHPIWGMVSSVLGNDVPGTISVYPTAGRVAALWTATAAAVFFLAVQFGRDKARARFSLHGLVLGGGLIAAYGLVEYLMGNERVLWAPKPALYLKALTATFIGRNAFADYSGIVLVCVFGLALDGVLKLDLRRPRATARPPAIGGGVMIGVLALVFAVDGAALSLTGSRAGVAVTIVAASVVSALLLARRLAGRTAFPAAVGLIAPFVVVIASVLGVLLASRPSALEDDFVARIAAYARVLAGIRAAPLLGYGLGAFEQTFPMFRDASVDPHGRWEYAHNDWLEAPMALGIPVGLMLWVIFGWILVRCVRGALRRGQDAVYPAIGAGAGVLAVLHSLVDFSLQIQGFTIPLMAMLGVGVAQSWSSRQKPLAS